MISEQNVPGKSRSPVPLGAMANSCEAFLERQIAELKSKLGESIIERSAVEIFGYTARGNIGRWFKDLCGLVFGSI